MVSSASCSGTPAELYGLVPDLVTFGKVVGGGMPVGAFAGRAELFEVLAPDGPVYQAGLPGVAIDPFQDGP